MLATNHNWRDVQKYYQGCFVKFKELGEVPYHIDNVTPSAIHAVNPEGKKLEVVLCEEGYSLDYIIPRKTVFQMGDNAAVLERVPARMWKKGLSYENSRIFAVLDNGDYSEYGFDAQTVNLFVNKPGYLTLEDFSSNQRLESIAISPRFYATRAGFIGTDQQMVAKFDKDDKTVYHFSLFEREMRNLFGFSGYKLRSV